MPRPFLQGTPVAFVFVPLAVIVMGHARRASLVTMPALSSMDNRDWAWKLPALAAAYVVLYFTAGYFIAWQNAELRAFYGRPGEVLPFFAHMAQLLREDPWLIPFQARRALTVGLLFSVPQNIGHVLPNSLLPLNSVRLSDLLETASSMFIFGLAVTLLLYPNRLRRRKGNLNRTGSTASIAV